MNIEDESKYASSTMKIPIFDGSDKSKYQNWEDDLLAVLEYHDIEEYVEESWKDRKMPDKTSSDENSRLQRKEMKKAKAIIVRATCDLPNMIAKDAVTPFEALHKLREKYSVKKVREDFDTLDTEWNDFKVNDISMDPDLIFKTLEEQSRKLAIFGEHYSKDSLQILSKLSCCLPSEYDHVFTYLNTNEERMKTFDEQLETAKTMIVSHFKTKIQGNDKSSSSMVFMTNTGNRIKNNNESQMKCDFCGKNGHTAYRDGKPFCFKLKRKIKKENKIRNDNDAKDINSLFINCVRTSSSSNINPNDNDNFWLGDTGAQCHVVRASDDEINSTSDTITMGNRSESKVLRIEDTTITNNNGHTMILQDARVVKDIETNIISLLQLVDEGWEMTTKKVKSKKIIYMEKDNKIFEFHERSKTNLCFLMAMLIDNLPIVNAVTESKSSKNKEWEFDDFHNKFGHHGENYLRAFANKLGYTLIGNVSNCDACDIVKTKAKPIPRITKTVVNTVGEKVGLDISGPFPLCSGTNHRPIRHKLYWCAIIDHYSRKMMNSFCYKKEYIINFVEEAHKFMLGRKTPIQCIRMDNAGENI